MAYETTLEKLAQIEPLSAKRKTPEEKRVFEAKVYNAMKRNGFYQANEDGRNSARLSARDYATRITY